MENVRKNLAQIIERIDRAAENRKNVKLIAVSKTKPVELILEAFEAGQTRFGENRVQEAREKSKHLSADIDWHLIGPLQKNKAKYCPAIFSTIHSLHRADVARLLNEKSRQTGRCLDVLIQMNLSGEPSKSGLSSVEDLQRLEDYIMECSHLRLTGLMTMGDPNASAAQNRRIFARLYEINHSEAKRLGLERQMVEISSGMSADFELALKEGATYIRIGSAIFGSRY